MVRVDEEGKFQRVSGVALRLTEDPLLTVTPTRLIPPCCPLCAVARPGTNIGGGTFWGLCKLLTGMDNFDDILSLSGEGDNSNVRRSPVGPS